MDWTCIYNQDVYLNGSLVGYISTDSEGMGILYIGKNPFCEIDEEGRIYRGDKKVGYIDDGGDVYMNGSLVGEVDSRNAVRFKGSF